MEFEYFGGAQRSPEWFQIRRGRVTASRLSDWLATSKAKGKEGQPLKARLDYEKELQFERMFDTSFETFVSQPMQDGIAFESFFRDQYQSATKNKVEEVGCWYNKYFVASPDGAIGKKGLLEIKVPKDTKFTEVLESGVPDEHWKQMQGQMFASGREWTDYVAGNLNTRKFKVIRVLADMDFQEGFEESIKQPLSVDEFDLDGVFDFAGEVDLDKIRAGQPEIVVADEPSELDNLGF